MSKKPKRAALSKKLRFEVFKRDSFTCQYCGAKAPDVVLQCDHIEPVAKGGKDDILNLITSCVACNGGKGAVPLADDSALVRQRQQLAELEERRQQIEMMVEWKRELTLQDDVLVNAIEKEIGDRTGWAFSESTRAKYRREIKAVGFARLFDAIPDAIARYARYDHEGKVTRDSAGVIFSKILTFAAARKRYGDDPEMPRYAYIQGILRNRCGDQYGSYIESIRKYHLAGISLEFMTEEAKIAESYEDFDIACWRLKRQFEEEGLSRGTK